MALLQKLGLKMDGKIERGETCVRITFCPMLQDQSAFSSSGIMADFVVQYDVVMEDIIGDVQSLPPVEKNAVFIIDVSSSMFGTKMKQVWAYLRVLVRYISGAV